MDEDHQIQLIVTEKITPVRDEVISLKTRVDVMDTDIREMKGDIKEVKRLVQQHQMDEQGWWNRVMEAHTRLQIRIAMIVGVGAGITILATFLHNIGFFGAN